MSIAQFDPLLFKTPIGAVSKGSIVTFKIKIDESVAPNEVYMLIKNDTDADYLYLKMERDRSFFSCCNKFNESGHFWYSFKLLYDFGERFLSKTYDSYSYLSEQKGEDFFQLVTECKYSSGETLQNGIMYQIMVDRFCRVGEAHPRSQLFYREDWAGKIQKNTKDPLIINKEVFGGNFDGIISKLDYLKSLNVSTIYLNPICEANSNHKYDTGDYLKIDTMFGGEEKFKKLIKQCNEKGIKIIIDGVYNHTGSDSVYFNKELSYDSLGAYNSKNSKYYNWYTFKNFPDEYESWWGINTLPSISDNAEDFQDFIAGKNGVIEKYMKLGLLGVRLDVVDELSDKFTKKISDRVKSFGKDKIVMGEVWEDASTKISYSSRRKYFSNNELNSVMNYPIKEAILNYLRSKNPFELNSTIRMIKNGYPKAVQDNLMNFLGTHDTGRIFSEISAITENSYEKTIKYLKIATTLMFTVMGVPTIFYGDERGMENNDGSARGCIDWNNCKDEVFSWYKKLAEIRSNPTFAHGDINVLYCKHGKFVFERVSEHGRIIVLTNADESALKINISGNFVSLLTNKKVSDFILQEESVEILLEK